MSQADDESSFFDRERDRLAREITSVSFLIYDVLLYIHLGTGL